jgi:enterochelin esterase-like enzyme
MSKGDSDEEAGCIMNPVDRRPLQSYTTGNRRPRRSAGRMQADGVFRWLSRLVGTLALFSLLALSRTAAASPPLTAGTSMRGAQPSPTAAPEAEKAACDSSHGSIEQAEIEVTGQPRPLPFRVYLPPCYEEDRLQRYPVLYLLHGLLGTDAQWDELGVDETADALITQGAVPPFLMVMPWERTGLTIEEALVDGLVPSIDEMYRTLPEARWRAIGGLSRGGGQALEIGLRHPDLFQQIGLHSPAVLHGDALILRWLADIPDGQLPAVWIDIGVRDSLFPSTAHLVELFFQQGIAPTLQFDEGDHEPAYWALHLEGYLRWHGGLWRAAQLQAEAHTRVP